MNAANEMPSVQSQIIAKAKLKL